MTTSKTLSTGRKGKKGQGTCQHQVGSQIRPGEVEGMETKEGATQVGKGLALEHRLDKMQFN
jgi:hypothetical protein